ncbi:hypothetical protein AAFF_G00162570 [Aldrovandia affinis]|uniref:Uncharacterized protein n=1 Tax=Aldrovandia affinis TaxID=143900 RepID=A0AAD7WX26_9TELE|nr:hypothetical protein AAFF_G00162570 [Aldrovandia affinis]
MRHVCPPPGLSERPPPPPPPPLLTKDLFGRRSCGRVVPQAGSPKGRGRCTSSRTIGDPSLCTLQKRAA